MENLWHLKNNIHDLINSGDVVIEAGNTPNLNKNLFPNHERVNMIITCERNEAPILEIKKIEPMIGVIKRM